MGYDYNYDIRVGRDPGEVGASSCLASLGVVLGTTAGIAIVIGIIVVILLGVSLLCCLAPFILGGLANVQP